MNTVKGINFWSMVFAGFTAGYLMYFVDFWFNGTLGLFGVFPGTADPWWMITHHVDSIVIFGLLFAWPAVYNRLPRTRWVKGIVYGFLVWLLVSIITWIAGALGAKFFANASMSMAMVLSSLLLHLVYGFVLGVLYNPPAEKE